MTSLKIALITIHNANNYGAILQTFAMQQALSIYGSVDIINYENRHVSRSFDLIRLKPGLHGLLGTGKDLFRLLPRYRAINKFKAFIEQELNVTERFTYADLISQKAAGYDVYVTGSDQIWNPMCVSEKGLIDPGYFLDFVSSEAKKISYASSIGGHKYSESETVTVKKLLSTFQYLAVREKETQVYLEQLLERPVKHVLDPTLLLDKQSWLDVVGVSDDTSEPGYILLYTVPKVSLIKEVVSFFSNKIGLKVVSVDQGLTAGAKVDEQIRDAGPKEFIKMFANASFVITDSFHGTCFALNFGIPFVAVSPGVHSNRIESLLNLIGLNERLIRNNSELKNISIELDMRSALDRLDMAREKSIKFLEHSLK